MADVWRPTVIEGGKGSILLPRDPDWLWELKIGDVFFCKKKDTPIFLQLFIVTSKMEEDENRFMRLENPENPTQYLAVDTRDFSRAFLYHMTVPGVIDDGGSNPVEEQSGMDGSITT